MDRKWISMARLAKDPEKIARELESSGAIYCIERRGRPAMLLMDEDAFETWMFELELERNPEMRERFARKVEESRRDFAEGRYHTLDEIEKELGLDRPAPRRRKGSTARASGARASKGQRRASRSRGRAA